MFIYKIVKVVCVECTWVTWVIRKLAAHCASKCCELIFKVWEISTFMLLAVENKNFFLNCF